MTTQALTAFYYAQPVALAALLLVSHLVLFRREKINTVAVHRSRSLYNTIWWLQALLALVLLADTSARVATAAGRLEYATPWLVLQAQLAGGIGVFLYFGAGILPDPDGPWTATPSNSHTWLLAFLFEAVTICIMSTQTEDLKPYESAEIGLAGLRAVVLMAMYGLFILPGIRDFKLDSSSDAERAALLQNENVNITSKDSINRLALATMDAQSTGWLDYFVGFSALLPYIWPSKSVKHQAILIVCFGLMVFQRVINILVPYQLGVLVDRLGIGRIPYQAIGLYCLYRGLQGQQGVIGSIRAVLWIPLSQLLYRNLTCDAFEHVLMLSLDFHLSKRIGEVMAALSKGGALNTFLDGFAFQLFPMVFDLGIAAVYLFINFDAYYSIIVIGVMWSYIFVTIYMAKHRGRARRQMAIRDREMDAAKTDAMMAYETVHHNGAVPLEVSRFRLLVESFQRAEYFVLFSLNGLNAIQNFIFTLGVVLVCLLSGYQISIGELRVPDFVTLITYLAQLHAPLAFFGSFYNQVQNNLVDAERMLDLFKHGSDVVDTAKARRLNYCEGEVKFENICFDYASGKAALKNISFEVKPGSTTAIVGESGSGKSTILKLLFHFYNPDKGLITFDGHEIRDITVESLRSYIGVVPQDTILFNDSIMYNLRYAKPTATDEEVYEACKAASIHHRICTFPEGYQTRVGERGLKLSGGEKQRISIARALLKDPQILLLDEATASLDTHTEKQIQKALESVTRGRTTITIAHRLSTITRADQIIVLHDGVIVERGTHVELLNRGGQYRAMWDKQTETEASGRDGQTGMSSEES